jgi:hypothetical protein
MHPSSPEGDLRELQDLARTLFEVLRERFTVDDRMEIEFDRIDSLADREIEQQHVVATTLLCAQLLHRITASPDRTQPRHVMTLCDIMDQTLTTLVEECDWDPAMAVVRQAHERICTLHMNLAMVADPGAPDFPEWSQRPARPS